MIAYENYHCHTFYSNGLTQPDSTVSIEEYAKEYQKRDMHVLCMSEHGNRGDVWKQFAASEKCSGEGFPMKPIAAAEAYFVPDRNPELKDKSNYHLILIAKDMISFRQLNRILSEANMNGFYFKARVDFDLLQSLDPRHFLCTTACVGGVLKNEEEGERMCCQLHEIFKDDFYLEIQHHPQEIQLKHNAKILALYKKYGWPLIYGTDSHYIKKEDSLLRKELLLSSRITYEYEDAFDLSLPTADEAFHLLTNQHIFSKAQIEEAMENTLQLRDFEGVSFTTEKKIPNSRPNLTLEERNKLYKKEVCNGYIAKAGMPSKEEAKALHEEMDAVTETGTADYFIGMKDVVDKGISYGGVLTTTGRGSGSSFATNYALGFTSINRLKCPVRLYPERFISKERLASGALPDLDLNMANVEAFERAGKEIFGEYGCLPMVAYGTVKTLSAFKLLARARNLDFDTSNMISKQIKAWEMDVKHAKENNQDDPDYDAEEDVPLKNYVDTQYLSLIDESKRYCGIITSLSPHPCAHLLLDKDIREEIGVIRLKPKAGSKEPTYVAYIDGATADAYGYLKADYLRVDVVKSISSIYSSIGLPVMPVSELLEKVKDDKEVWDLYAKGFTMGLNQCEREKTTQRVMRYKPRNVVELAAFVAAVRPGFKSMVDIFVNRQRFSYGITSLDNLLATKEIPDSFLLYDEQILRVLQAGGIPAADAYACTKAIKKKKAAKVASYRERFEPGFTKYLKETEGSTDEEAKTVVDKIWTIINDAASYMFCAAHAYSMACDSLYSAYLKVHYPYEFYLASLKLYDEKGNKEKITAYIAEMKRYKNISMTAGQFGKDNRDWSADKENQTISQSLSALKYMSPKAAADLYQVGQDKPATFTDLLFILQRDTCLNSRQIDELIALNYFACYGKPLKLWKLWQEFQSGKNRITKTLKSFDVRLKALREIEAALPNEDLSVGERIAAESEYVGMCLSVFPECDQYLYFVDNVDAEYGVKVKLYHPKNGSSGIMRMTKSSFGEAAIKQGEMIEVVSWKQKPRYSYAGGVRKQIPGEYDMWLDAWQTVPYEKHILTE